MTEKKTAPKTADEYMAGLPPKMLPALQSLRAAIKAAAPEAEEVIRMGAVTYLYHGNLVSFSAAAKHCAFYVMAAGPIARRREQLKDYDTAPSAIRFSPEKPLSAELVMEIVRDRMRENERRG